MQQQVQAWITANWQSVEEAMQQQNATALALPDAQARVTALLDASAAATGETAAIQAGNQLLGNLTTQLAQMQGLLVTQARAFDTIMAARNEETALDQQKNDLGMSEVGTYTPQSTNLYGNTP